MLDHSVGSMSQFTSLVDALDAALPALDRGAFVGMGVYPYPIDRDVARYGGCAFPTTLAVPLGVASSGTIVQTARGWDPHSCPSDAPCPGPWGGAPVYEVLRFAQYILEDYPLHEPRFVVLVSSGLTDCNSQIVPDQCACFGAPASACLDNSTRGTDACSDARRTADEVRALRRDGVTTLVLGAAQDFDGTLSALAEAGGAARRGAGHVFYAVDEHAAIRQAFRDVILDAAYCHLHLSAPPPPSATYGVATDGGGALMQDPSHTDGWDWIDASAPSVELFGSACEAARRGQRFVLTTPEPLCE